MDILVTGGTGQVGLELLSRSWPEGVRLHAPGRAELDLSDPASVRRTMDKRSWSAVISSGAYTAVDKAEGEVESAWTTNAVAPAILARRSAELRIPIVHVSTDYVFDGSKAEPYLEGDAVGPINVYGASKEGGEQAIRTGNPRHAILRTAWVVSHHRSNFLRTMLKLAGEREEVRVVADQRGSPTFAGDLAAALQAVTIRLLDDPGTPSGTWHFVNAGDTDWAGFATAIFAASAEQGGPSARVAPIATADYPTPARRPRNSRLSTAAIERDFGLRPRHWREALVETIARLA